MGDLRQRYTLRVMIYETDKLTMSRDALHLFDAPENLTTDQIAPLMEATPCDVYRQAWIPAGGLDDAICPRHD